MYIILTKQNQDILGSDGLMIVDGRKSNENIAEEVRERNSSLKKNFPHLVCDGWYKCSSQGLSRNSIIYSI